MDANAAFHRIISEQPAMRALGTVPCDFAYAVEPGAFIARGRNRDFPRLTDLPGAATMFRTRNGG